jgi:AraC family transcriptional regulator
MKGGHGMNTLNQLNDALEYIERNLEYEVDDNEIARRAYCSVYHFKRMFSFLAGIPLQEYIRRRRLTLAALELQDRSVKVIDIAVKYGYQSPDAFTRAFQSLHGISPSEARLSSRSLKAYPPMTFRLTIGGREPMKYRIEQKDAFQLIGISNHVVPVSEGDHPGVLQVWRDTDQLTYDQLLALNDVQPSGILHVDYHVGEQVGNEYEYLFGVASSKECPPNFTSLMVPAHTWVVFEILSPWERGTWHSIYGEWFPTSGYEQVKGPTFQVGGPEITFGAAKQVYTKYHEVEFWVPVVKVRL